MSYFKLSSNIRLSDCILIVTMWDIPYPGQVLNICNVLVFLCDYTPILLPITNLTHKPATYSVALR